MMWLSHYSVLSILPTVVLLHLFSSPYTKVEESFNIQAIHDIVTYGIPFQNPAERLQQRYDHVSFPGAVPRTFVGALSVASVSLPFIEWLPEPEHAQILVRGVVGLINSAALLYFQHGVSQAFGSVAGYWYLLLQSSQFHVMYYASRTLPNMYAFSLCTIALRFLMLSNWGPRPIRANRTRIALYLLTIAGIIFRSELALLLATHVVWLFVVRNVSLRHVIIPAGIAAMTAGLTATVCIDSFFWQKFPLWPEWVAFRYNTIAGKSSDWGTSPWYFYFTSAIPRLMLNPLALLLCVPVALADRLTRRFSIDMLAPLFGFVALYSFLPHKEWRFILYIIPSLTAVAAAGAAYIWNRRAKHWVFRLLSFTLVGSVLLSFVASSALLYVSSLNYPGAEALNRLHDMAHGERPLLKVHLDNLACQTGVTRFLQKPAPGVVKQGWESQTVWYYDKTEDPQLLLDPLFWERFDYVVAEGPERVIGKWEIVDVVDGFAGVGLARDEASRAERDKGRWMHAGRWWETYEKMEQWCRSKVTRGWWIKIKMEPKLKILRKQEL